ncbi:DUF1302 domain-containing protein [Pseudomonas sp. A-1]|uniref:DUF1302 domain-containing protein n=1 Tax=Pseudomonas sp. A-1 TaxID=1821274 RepID=UPI0010A64C3D|nr:DUF1302 family protein [Pseudomonas sp. A-1]THG83124.1 DUF1302 domain-containing protein [Pseudomonas sp. A-1]
MHNKKNPRCTTLVAQSFPLMGLAAAIAMASGAAHAGETIEFDNGATLDWTITANYGIGMRTESPDSALIDGPLTINMDDGNRNFDKGSLVTNRVGALAELILRKDDYGAVLRASTFYDDVYHQSNDNDAPGRVNKFGAHDEFTSDAKRYSGGRSRILDAYLFSGWRTEGGQSIDVKAGRHVVSWGESLIFPGVSGAQSPVDVVKASLPGIEAKEVLLPIGQVSGQWSLNESFSLGAYVQYEWSGNELAPAGSYMSTSDVTGPGRELLRAGALSIPYLNTNEPRDSGQWGLQMRYRPTADLELSLFRINYHDRNPSGVSISFPPAGPLGYEVNYFEDIHLTGLSFSTKIGDTQVGGEWSYRDGAPVNVLTAGGPQATKGKGQQMQLSFMRILGDRPWASQTTFMGEVVHVRVDDVDALNGADDYTFKTASAWKSKTATAYSLVGVFNYPGVFTGWDLDVPVRFSHVVEGATPMSGTISGAQGDRRMTVGTTFKYMGNLEVALAYNAFLGEADPIKRQLADRDYATLSLKYSL